MCQLSNSPDLSGGVAEGRRFVHEGEVAGEDAGEETGEVSLGDAGGEGGSAARSLWRE